MTVQFPSISRNLTPGYANAAAHLMFEGGRLNLRHEPPESAFSIGNMVIMDLTADGPLAAIEDLASLRRADLILAEADPLSQLPRFRLGVSLFWTTLWHANYLLWLPQDGRRPCFVPGEREQNMFFWIEDGRLACDRGAPFADEQDRVRGVGMAKRAMTSFIRSAA